MSISTSLSLELSQLVDPFNTIQNPCESIQNGEFICKDCNTLGFCVQQNGQWLTAPIIECDPGQSLFCDEEVRGCTFQKECKLANRAPKFECQNSGTYPDPYECKYYHVCDQKNQDTRMMCPSGTAYSPATKSCSLSSTDEICFVSQYTCTKVGEMGAWPTDPNIYYVCHVKNNQIYPILYRCQNGYTFNYGKCMAATAQTEATTTVLPTTCTPGSGLVANPNDCYSYMVCSNGQLVNLKCSPGTYFDAKTKRCEFGSC